MSRLDVLHSSGTVERSLWLREIRAWEHAPPFAFPAYMEAFCAVGCEPVLLVYRGSKGRGLLPLVIRSIPGQTELVDAVGPYGYGVALWNGDVDEMIRFWEAVTTWAQSASVVSVVVRVPVVDRPGESWPFPTYPVMRNVVWTLAPWETLWTDVEHKVRKNYKRANSFNLTFEVHEASSVLDQFVPVYQETMDRRDAVTQVNSEQLRVLADELADRAIICLVKSEGEVISTEMCLLQGRDMYSFLGGTLAETFHMRPNDFLKCEMARWGFENAFENYVLGGGYGSDDGIFRYKMSFAPHGSAVFRLGEWIVDPAAYQRLAALQDSGLDGFLPKYRAPAKST